ncbi:MAG: hypothetical protein IPM57_08015 [Oligoflexia bacterium]|nr:hypothetical protein [Oligoflexia bacterium]
MRILLTFSFLVTFQISISSWANTPAISSCIRALSNLSGVDFVKGQFSQEQALSILKSKTPDLVWYEESNFQSSIDSKEAVLFAKEFINQKLKELSQRVLKNKDREINQVEMIKTLRLTAELAKEVEKNNFAFIDVARLMAAFTFIVDHVDNPVKSKQIRKLDFRKYFDEEVAFTVQEELVLENHNESRTSNLGIKPRVVFTVKPIDEIDLMLSPYAGVFYIEKSPAAHNVYDMYQEGRGSTDKASHDMFHAQTKIINLTNNNPVLRDLVRRFYLEKGKMNSQEFFDQIKPEVIAELRKHLKLTQRIIADALVIEDLKLRAAIIITLFQQSHEMAEYIAHYPLNTSHHVSVAYIHERYQKNEYDHKFKELKLTLTDFENARTWILNWLSQYRM